MTVLFLFQISEIQSLNVWSIENNHSIVKAIYYPLDFVIRSKTVAAIK